MVHSTADMNRYRRTQLQDAPQATSNKALARLESRGQISCGQLSLHCLINRLFIAVCVMEATTDANLRNIALASSTCSKYRSKRLQFSASAVLAVESLQPDLVNPSMPLKTKHHVNIYM